MPPPGRPEVSGPDSSGVVVLSGYAPPESWVYANNETTGYSSGNRAEAVTGKYRFPILAAVGDYISLFYRQDTEDSPAVVFRIPTFTAYPRANGAAAGMTGTAGAWMAGAAGDASNLVGQGGAGGSP